VPGKEEEGMGSTAGDAGMRDTGVEDTGVEDAVEEGVALDFGPPGLAFDFFFFHRSSGDERGLTDGAAPLALEESRLGSFTVCFFAGMTVSLLPTKRIGESKRE